MKLVLQHVDGDCDSSISEAPSKRSKHLRHKVHNSEFWPLESGGGGSSKRTYKNGSSECYKDKSQYICKYIIERVAHAPYLHPVTGHVLICISLSITILTTLGAQHNLPGHRWLLEERPTMSARKRATVELCKATIVTGWDSLPYNIRKNVLQRLEFKDLFRFKVLSNSCKEHIESDAFLQWRGANCFREGSFTAINYFIKNKVWQCSGFDLDSKTWRTLPPFSYLPHPDAELFKEYSVCGNGALMCADVAKLPKKDELIVFNPLTGKKRVLPRLLYRRSPVLVHISLNAATKSYKVIVAGSSTESDEHLSKKMEVFDSQTSMWEEACDLPGPAFVLNEHQSGVCLNGILYFISFLEGNGRKGVVAFDVENRKWLEDMACPIPFSMYSNILQLVESDGEVYLFSEQERGVSVEHCIDVLEFSNPKAAAVEKRQWRNVVRVKKAGGRGLQVYPEHTCVAFGEGKLCVFNTLTRDGVVYDMQDGTQVEVLQPPPLEQQGEHFFSWNPASFTLQPSFDSNPIWHGEVMQL